jgi:hypothetical protein
MAGNPFKNEELTTSENIVAAWPLLMVLIGGLLGGLLGGLAWAVNVKILQTDANRAVAYIGVIVSGLVAIGAYLAIVTAIALKYPDLIAQ